MDHLATQVAINVGVGCVAAAGAVVGTHMWETRRTTQEARRRCLEEPPPFARKVWVEMDPNAQSFKIDIEKLFDAIVMPYSIRDPKNESDAFKRQPVGVYVVRHVPSVVSNTFYSLAGQIDFTMYREFQARYDNAIMAVITKCRSDATPLSYGDLFDLRPKVSTAFRGITVPLRFTYADGSTVILDLSERYNRETLQSLQTFVTDALYNIPARSTQYV